MHRIPVDGEYVVRVFLGGTRPADSEPVDDRALDRRRSEVAHASSTIRSDRRVRSDDRQDFGGQTVEFRVRLTAGEHWLAVAIPRIFEGLPRALRRPESVDAAAIRRAEFKPPAGRARRNGSRMLRKRFDEAQAELEKIPLNGVRVSHVEVGGPVLRRRPAPSRESLREDLHLRPSATASTSRPACAAIMTESGAPRVPPAGRRRARSDKYVALVQRRAEAGAIVRGRARRRHPGAAGVARLPVPHRARSPGRRATGDRRIRITQHELASRLSYFLWASMPDAELRRAADAGTLRNPAVLDGAGAAHAARSASRARWPRTSAASGCSSARSNRSTRDRERFPDFEDYLRLSMRRETELFVEHVIREDRSILDFLDGRYSFLNERLARHYGIAGVTGPGVPPRRSDRHAARRRR